MGIVHEGSGMAPAFRLFSYFWKIIAFPESVFWASKGGVRFYFNGKFRQMEKKVSHLHSHQFIATVIPFLLTFECLTVLASMLISRVLAVSAQTLALVWRWVGTEEHRPAASCFDGSRLPWSLSDPAGTSRQRRCQKNYSGSHFSEHGVPPGGKVQQLHMVSLEDYYDDDAAAGAEGGASRVRHEAICPVLRDFN